jgi:hypothetical protein
MSRYTPGRTGPLAHWYRKASREFLAAVPLACENRHEVPRHLRKQVRGLADQTLRSGRHGRAYLLATSMR